MARAHDAHGTLRALAKYGEAILEAHLRNGNRVPDSDDNLGLIETLEHHRLVWRIGDNEDLQLKKVLVQFLDHITESERRRYASAQVDILWQQLSDLFLEYKEAKKRSALTDIDRLEGEIKECLADVIEDIRNATEAFATYINTGFAYITDLQLRIRENERVIERAGRLITLFESFRIRELAEQAGSDAFLKRLLLRHLPATLESSQKNLSYALNQLRKMLVRMREDQRLSRMVGAFEAHFINNRGFEPSIDHLDLRHVPEYLNTVEPFQIKGFGDIYDSADDLELIEIAAKARTIPIEIEDKSVPEGMATVNFDVDGETEVEEEDPVEEAIEGLIQQVVDGALGERSILASEALASTGLEIDKADWLQAIVSEIESLSDGDQQYIEVIYHRVPHRIYPDNVMVSDLTLRHSNAC
ncbi:hypothetical protein [Marinobacter salexigens]|uniref:Phosphoenolpyruvate carboxylase n=1 Tax=Marinobacter salexigens TaxID=1925763 RepID=A0ABS6ABH4_9GAMM|nr:hypothetical protein [Marinobacter salexigens]MBU2874537.1 hypothetical protein [Marinobacter salexigens]